MVKIVGVDFSGGDEIQGSGTWITEGQLEKGKFVIECCRPTRRDELENVLKDLPDGAVAAMDFPFSVPKALSDYWNLGSEEMPDLWCAAATMHWDGFKTKCNNYMNGQKEGYKHPLRIGDLFSNEPMSCLNKRIMPMTFYGMELLHRLWESKRGFRVPPLHASRHKGPVLLEVMPGAALETFRLPSERYKNVTKKIGRLEIGNNRNTILLELEDRSEVEITNLDRFCGTYLSHHDGLDSLIAAVVAARWKTNESQFNHPSCYPTDCRKLPNPRRCRRASKAALAMPQKEAARLEGWIYMPSSARN